MTAIPTIKITDGKITAIINESDLKDWEGKGWKKTDQSNMIVAEAQEQPASGFHVEFIHSMDD